MVALGDLLHRSGGRIVIDPDTEYRQLTVRLWGKGVVLRGVCRGADIAASEQVQVRAGQFVMSRIDARHGAFGLVPCDLDGAVVSGDFPCFDVDHDRLLPGFMAWLSKTESFIAACKNASEGTTNRVRLKETRFLASEIELPPLAEQRRIVARLDAVAKRLAARQAVLHQQQAELDALLHAAFARITAGAPKARMADIAPLVRRPVEIKPERLYTEIGIRSFFRGIFHRRTIEGAEFTWQNLFEIAQGDIVFSNLMAWEKAIGLAGADDDHCVGNHRMLTCQPDTARVVPGVVHFYFSTPEGFTQIEDGSPGSIARNKTLSPVALHSIEVPVPSLDAQHWFDRLHSKITALRAHHAAITADSDTLLPAMLNQIFT
jgi:type I restriction enzyme S subunit